MSSLVSTIIIQFHKWNKEQSFGVFYKMWSRTGYCYCPIVTTYLNMDKILQNTLWYRFTGFIFIPQSLHYKYYLTKIGYVSLSKNSVAGILFHATYFGRMSPRTKHLQHLKHIFSKKVCPKKESCWKVNSTVSSLTAIAIQSGSNLEENHLRWKNNCSHWPI